MSIPLLPSRYVPIKPVGAPVAPAPVANPPKAPIGKSFLGGLFGSKLRKPVIGVQR